MNKEIAIKADNISKTFHIPHEKITTLRGAFVNMFSRLYTVDYKCYIYDYHSNHKSI